MKAPLFVWVCRALAAAWPGMASRVPRASDHVGHAFPGWPETFEEKPWIHSSRPGKDAAFAAGFAGRTAVFRQEARWVVLRWLEAPSRAVHPAADCFRARGYRVDAPGLVRDEGGFLWTEFSARRGNERWRVRERLVSEVDPSLSWTDVSAWYWAALFEPKSGPWRAITVAIPERERD